jgi:hypothetical protein
MAPYGTLAVRQGIDRRSGRHTVVNQLSEPGLRQVLEIPAGLLAAGLLFE